MTGHALWSYPLTGVAVIHCDRVVHDVGPFAVLILLSSQVIKTVGTSAGGGLGSGGTVPVAESSVDGGGSSSAGLGQV